MAFKLTVFIGILITVAVLGMRGYSASVRRFEAGQARVDEGVPDDIPHENLYGISWNPMNTMAALRRIDGAATARRVGTSPRAMVGASASATINATRAFFAATTPRKR